MRIPILHLEDGFHVYDFTVKAGALHFYRQEVYPEEMAVHVEVNKYEKNIQCALEIHTMGHYTCDRCLADYVLPFEDSFQLLFHLGQRDLITDEEDVIVLPAETVEIDLTDWVIEMLILDVPMKMLCREDCKGICPGCGADLNLEACTCAEVRTDPRWEKLKQLLK